MPTTHKERQYICPIKSVILDLPSTDVLHSSGGKQSIVSKDGYHIPLAVREGLCYMDMRPPTDEELDSLPQLIFTADEPWTPNKIDSEPDDGLAFFDADNDDEEHGDIFVDCDDGYEEDFSTHEISIMSCLSSLRTAMLGTVRPPRNILPCKPDFEALRPFFGWASANKVHHTLKHTTQWFHNSCCLPMRHHYKTRFPAANVSCWNEDVSTDTFFSDTPAHDDGITGHGSCTMAQLYTGITSHFTKIFPMYSQSQIPSTLQSCSMQTRCSQQYQE